jgi:hypothetical protein
MKFFDALLILFIGLKLTGYIDWSWWLVFSPLMFTFGLYVVIEYVKRNRGIR